MSAIVGPRPIGIGSLIMFVFPMDVPLILVRWAPRAFLKVLAMIAFAHLGITWEPMAAFQMAARQTRAPAIAAVFPTTGIIIALVLIQVPFIMN